MSSTPRGKIISRRASVKSAFKESPNVRLFVKKMNRKQNNSQSVAALTARQYRNNKRMEFEEMKSRLQRANAEVEHYKSLYEMMQTTLIHLSKRFVLSQAVVNYDPNKQILNIDSAQSSPSADSLSCDTDVSSSADEGQFGPRSPDFSWLPEWDQALINPDPVLSDF